MKFEGILFLLNKPPAQSPRGCRGHKILFTPATIEKALEQLPGKPLFSSQCLTTHDITNPIGIIEKAFIVGDMFCISGSMHEEKFISQHLNASGETLGLSFDVLNANIEDLRQVIWTCIKADFIGATMLLQSKAAYREDCLFWFVED
jgi:hypothetical protein